MAITKNLAIGNLSPDAVFDILQNKGLSATEATSFIGTWLLSTIGQAKRTFTVEDLAEQTKGVCCRKDSGVLDEIPSAYKNIDQVMENQKDLVEIVHTLRQVLCVKG